MELTNEFDVTAPIDEAWRILTDLELIAPCMPGAKLTEVEGDEFRGSVKVKVGPITAQFKGKASFVERDAEAHRAVMRGEGRDTGGKGNANALITAQLAPNGEGTHVTITTDLSITGRVAQFGRGALADVSTKLLGQFVTCLETRVLAGRSADGSDAEVGAAEPIGGPSGSEPVPAEDAPVVRDPADIAASTGPSRSDDAAPSGAPAATEPRVPSSASPAAATTPGAAPSGIRTIDAPEPEPVDLLGTAGAPVVRRLAPLAVALLVLLVLLRRRRRR